MSDALKVLSNIRTLRVQARELDLAILDELLEKFTAVVEERREEEKQQAAEQNERQEMIAQYQQMMIEDGIRPEDLLSILQGSVTKDKKSRDPRPAKYKYDDNGVTKTWTGQGRTPKAIAEQMAAGKTLEDFAI